MPHAFPPRSILLAFGLNLTGLGLLAASLLIAEPLATAVDPDSGEHVHDGGTRRVGRTGRHRSAAEALVRLNPTPGGLPLGRMTLCPPTFLLCSASSSPKAPTQGIL